MSEAKPNYPLRTGLLIVALTWFVFTGYEFLKGAFNIGRDSFWISLTDTAGIFGLGFRTMAALIAVCTILFFIVKKNLSKPELLMSIRWVLLGETVCFLALFPVVVWGFVGIAELASSGLGPSSGFAVLLLIESTIPVLIESVVIPFVLVRLFLELSPSKPAKGAIKWGLIGGTVYVFVFWLNNTNNWIFALFEKGTDYLILYPANMFSFLLTSVGLLALAIFTAYFAKKSIGAESLENLNLRWAGAIVTFLGFYFALLYVMWMFLGDVGGFSGWYAWFLGHNMDLWALSLPLVGLPLLFHRKRSNKMATSDAKQDNL